MAAAAAPLLLGAAPAAGEKWDLVPSVSLLETLTNNVNLTPSGDRQADLVTQITPLLRLSGKSAHSSVDGFIAVPILLYARRGSENNTVYPSVSLRGNAELVDNFLYIDGSVSVAQQFFSPFGAQPIDLANSTQNRYTTQSYLVSPYIRGTTVNNVTYELRNTNVWTNLSGAPVATDNSHYSQWTGYAASNKDSRIGWQANFDVNNITFNNANTIKTRLVRFVPIYNVDPQFRLKASVGYEENEYTLTSSNDVIYGVGFEWHPTQRTQVVGNWEHRFFGSSYLFTFDHRTPLSVWNLRISRNITTYPQQLATLPGGISLPGLLDGLFRSSIPDPAERARAVEQFLQTRGLPPTLSSPTTLYSQAVLLQEEQSATVGFLGARNSLFFTVFNVNSQQITGSGEVLPPAFAFGQDLRQSGASVVWTHNVTPSVVLTSTLGGYRSVSSFSSEVWTNQGVFNMQLSSPLSDKTSAWVGARFQVLHSNPGAGYNEAAAFVGLSHSFR